MKIFLISLYNINDIIDKLIYSNNSLSLCKRFTNNIEYINYTKDNNNNIYYIDTQIIITAIKNNAILYVGSDEYIDGVMLDDYYNSSIVATNIVEFNKIPEILLSKTAESEDILFVFIDNSNISENKNVELHDYNYFYDRISQYPNIYLLNEPHNNIVNILYKYITGNKDIREDILRIYN